MSVRRSKRAKPVAELKPYGFCCRAGTDLPRYGRNPGIRSSLDSLRSLHECPALRLVTQEIVKRPKRPAGDAVDWNDHHLSSTGAGGALLGSAGGRMSRHLMPTESEIELLIDEARKRRQEEYERNMDRWAELAEKRIIQQSKRKVKCPAPCWYTEFSDVQLRHLRELEYEMFKDKEEKTIDRTESCLGSMGMVTEVARVEPRVMRRLIVEYSEDPLTFLREVYRALNGRYFEEEGSKNEYLCHERVLLSGIVFLELPRVIEALHERLPPVDEWSFPPKPERPVVKIPRKVSESPLLEKLRMPYNWRLYRTRLFEWHVKCSSGARPVAILPKKKSPQEDTATPTDVVERKIEEVTEDTTNNGLEKDDSEPMKTDEVDESELREDVETADTEVPETRGRDLYQMKTDWTTPQTPCPYKYRRLLDERGPLATDEQFFTELNRTGDEGKREFPAGRENLSPKMRSFLCDVEADFFELTREADRITGAVNDVVKEMQVAEFACDACCACRQIKKQHVRWHADKSPYGVIDGVNLDEDGNGQVIGAIALHSPASSMSSLSQPVCVPSKEKLVKNKIIAGAIAADDGEVVNLIDGCTKALEHVSAECLRSACADGVKNVPPCGCSTEDTGRDDEDPTDSKYENVCFGKKFRPDEGPAYECPEFGGQTTEVADDDCGCEEGAPECSEEGADDELPEDGDCCGAYLEEKPEKQKKKDECNVCKKCGKKQATPCGKKKGNSKNCECESLSEFLRMDLTELKCAKPPRKQFFRESQKGIKKPRLDKSKCKQKREVQGDQVKAKKARDKRPKRVSRAKECSKERSEEASLPENTCEVALAPGDDGGPYGYRTASEEALPTERTIAYLVNRCPPDTPAEMVAVREGGRACRCRENRNNRKTLLYNVGAVSDESGRGVDSTQVVEGVCWLTPVPSIRRSDEYIPEYELYDSPYGRPRKPDAPVNDNKDADDVDKTRAREKGWHNAAKDEYLTDFFTKKRDGGVCGDACPKCRTTNAEPRKLKVMKPVCECGYERKIVKRNEDRQRWAERQRRLKAMDKEACLHVTEISGQVEETAEEEPVRCGKKGNQALTVVADVVMQTPCVTPSSSQHSPLFAPHGVDKVATTSTPDGLPVQQKVNKVPDANKNVKATVQVEASGNQYRSKSRNRSSASDLLKNGDDKAAVDKNDEVAVGGKGEQKDTDTKVVPGEIGKSGQRRASVYYRNMEEDLKNRIAEELQQMAQEGFVTVKLPNYHEMPQISYWISYRVRGIRFTEKHKKKLMKESMKVWEKIEHNLKPGVEADEFQVSRKERSMLNFGYVMYWKRKIAKKQLEFYTNLRQDVVNYGRTTWRTMEYGKFPNVLFKQAFFTYFPWREKDAFVFRPL